MPLLKTLTLLLDFFLTIYIIVDDPIHAAGQLNLNLAKIHRWADKWLGAFNSGKSESILLSRKQNKPYHPLILFNQTKITEDNSHKHPGIIFSNDCTWHEHLELVKPKAWKRITIMCKLKFQLDQAIYISQYESNELGKIQNEAARIVTGATKLASINSPHRNSLGNTGIKKKNP